MSKRSSVILGIDPGYADTGYGVITTGATLSYVTCDTITTKRGPLAGRLVTLFNALERLLTAHQPTLISVERIYFAKNTKTALDVAHARGVVLLSAALHHVPIVEYTPMEVKLSLTSYGHAAKSQVALMVRTLLKLPTLPKKDDAIDALAVAVCASFRATKTA